MSGIKTFAASSFPARFKQRLILIATTSSLSLS